MGIINMNSYLFAEMVQAAVHGYMIPYNILAGGRHQKILLRQTKQLPFIMIIRRVQHLANDFCINARLQRA